MRFDIVGTNYCVTLEPSHHTHPQLHLTIYHLDPETGKITDDPPLHLFIPPDPLAEALLCRHFPNHKRP